MPRPPSASRPGLPQRWLWLAAALVLLAAAGAGLWQRSTDDAPAAPPQPPARRTGPGRLQIQPGQLDELKVGAVQLHAFAQRREAIGVIDFDQERQLQIQPPWQGRIGRVAVSAGDNVEAGTLLYTVLVPDLPQAASSLVAAASQLKVATEALARARTLSQTQSLSQKDLQQAVADQQTAEAAWRAARKSLALFGLSEREIAQIEQGGQIDSEMPVRSPQPGRVVARAAAPGQLVQPGSSPAPVTVADLRRVWMVASVPESEIGALRVGQPMQVQVPAWPGERFAGTVSYVADAADPATRRFSVRASVPNPRGQLKPQMSATFTIQLGPPVRSLAVAVNAMVREGDGSHVVWTTQENRVFVRRTVRIGLTQDGLVQITEGLQPGELVAQDRALFLSNLDLTAD